VHALISRTAVGSTASARSEPPGCAVAAIQAVAAFYRLDLSEFILPYESVRSSSNSDQLLLDFFRSTDEVGATLGGWDRAALERPDLLGRRKGANR
jgi:Family of unknown function (DUF5996)